MKKIIISLLSICVFCICIDRVGGWLMKQCLVHTNAKTEVKIEYLVKESNEDIVLMGTSRCAYHYIPSIIIDSLHASVYNGGISASDNIFSHYILFHLLLSHHTPKVICLELMENDMVKSEQPFNTISFFAPYFGYDEQADSVYMEAGTYWKYKFSHLYRFNSKCTEAIGGLFVNHKYGEDHGYFRLLEKQGNPDKLQVDKRHTDIDSLKLEYVRRFANECKNRGIKLIFMISPKYSVIGPHHYDALKEIAKEKQIPFLDYHSKGLFLNNPEYFMDNEHLWEEGAKIYTSIFSHDLKEILSSIP